MGTYKHMGRLRLARLVGRQLATFHLRLGQAAHAASLLTDALKTYQEEGWGRLAAQLLLQLAHCYQLMDDRQRYTQTCALVAASEHVPPETRLEFAQRLREPAPAGEPRLSLSAEEVVTVTEARLAAPDSEPAPGARVQVLVTLQSRLPAPLPLQCARADLQPAPAAEQVSRSTSSASTSSAGSGRRGVARRPSSPAGGDAAATGAGAENQLCLEPALEYKQDRSLSAATLVCRNMFKVLRRKDSGQPAALARSGQLPAAAFQQSLEATEVTLQPGGTELTLSARLQQPGAYTVRYLQLSCPALDLTLDLGRPLRLAVKSSPHQVSLNKAAADLLAGTVQPMTLQVRCGSEPLSAPSAVRLQCSRGLSVRAAAGDAAAPWSDELELQVPPLQAFRSAELPVSVLSQLAHVKDGVSVMHKVGHDVRWCRSLAGSYVAQAGFCGWWRFISQPSQFIDLFNIYLLPHPLIL